MISSLCTFSFSDSVHLHYTHMQDVPSLKTSEGRLLASGKDQIRQKIAALNDGVRDDGHQVRAAIVFIIMSIEYKPCHI